MNGEVSVQYPEVVVGALAVAILFTLWLIGSRQRGFPTAPRRERRARIVQAEVPPTPMVIAGFTALLHRVAAEECLTLVIRRRCGRWVRVSTRGFDAPEGVPVESPDADFNARFEIAARRPGVPRRLTPAVIESLWHLGSLGPISVVFSRRKLNITVLEEADLRSLLDRAEELVRALGREAGIEWLAEFSRTGTCGSCGVALSGELTICGRCGLPQHAECFAFIGGCAAYGCERRRSA